MSTTEDKAYGIRKLIDYGRFTSAIEEASHIADDLDKDTIIEVLYGFIKSEPEHAFRVHSYQIESLFDKLEKSEVENTTMIQLEWLYMPILGYSYGDTKTPRLHKEMSVNPDFFMDVISLVYKSDNSVEDNSDQEEVVAAAEAVEDSESIVKADVAYQAYSLLNHWSTIPGVDEQLNIDNDMLKNWVDVVRNKASEKGLLHAVDNQIGNVFATFPEPNGKMEEGKPISWPPEPFCEILESSDSTQMLSGFSVNCYNKRGSSSRSPFDGGTREHHLSKYFKALAAERVARYPKVAALFEQLARGYEQEAKREDERAERDRLDY